MPNYDRITTDQFHNALKDLISNMSAAEILSTPGAWEVFSEALNNKVLEDLTCDHCGGEGHLEPEEMEEFQCPHCTEGIKLP